LARRQAAKVLSNSDKFDPVHPWPRHRNAAPQIEAILPTQHDETQARRMGALRMLSPEQAAGVGCRCHIGM